jgi:hypothetical protein
LTILLRHLSVLAPGIRVLEARDERSYDGRSHGTVEALYKFPVMISRRLHPIPSRTRKLSSLEPMVLLGRPSGRVGRRRDFLTEEPRLLAGRIPRTEPTRSFVWAFCVCASDVGAPGTTARRHDNALATDARLRQNVLACERGSTADLLSTVRWAKRGGGREHRAPRWIPEVAFSMLPACAFL